MNKNIFIPILSIVLTLTTNSYADGLIAYKKGQTVQIPSDGFFVDKESASNLVAKLDSIPEQINIEVNKCIAETTAKLSYLRIDNQLKIQQIEDSYSAKNKLKDEQIKQLQKVSTSHSSTWIVVSGIVGVVVGAASVVGIVYATK